MRFGMIVVMLGLAVAAPADADPAAAKKANAAGMKAYKKQDYEAAQKLFEKAIAEDPGFVKAHYNRASMAALQRDTAVMAEEFAWLRAATAPEAARVLAKAKSDADFRGVASIDSAREIIGLPPVAETPIDALLLGYGGWWAGVDEGMMEGWIEMQFKPGGKVVIADFAPHALEFLRDEHQHRRLGFADKEVAQWCKAAGLSLAATRALPPRGESGLTVMVWLAVAPAVPQRRAKTAEAA